MRRQPAMHAIILAAGPSPLAVPKALARFGERTALDIALANCAGLATPVVVLGSDAAAVRSHIPKLVRILLNSRWRAGQVSSLKVALRSLPAAADFILYPVDYPLVSREILQSLLRVFHDRAGNQMIIVPTHRGRTGHPIVMSGELRRELQRAETARDVVYRDAMRVLTVEVGTPAIWRDLDSPAAYRRARREYELTAVSTDSKERVGTAVSAVELGDALRSAR